MTTHAFLDINQRIQTEINSRVFRREAEAADKAVDLIASLEELSGYFLVSGADENRSLPVSSCNSK